MNLWRDIFKLLFQERNKDLSQRMIILSQKGMNRMYFQELRIRCKETPERLFFRRKRITGAVIILHEAKPPIKSCISLGRRTVTQSTTKQYSLRAPKATSQLLSLLDSYQFREGTQSISIITKFINILLPRLVASYDFS